MLDTLTINILPDGTVEVMQHEGQNPLLKALSAHGSVSTRRASHVYPATRLRKWAFYALRGVFGETGRVAMWTRSWRGEWLVDLAPSFGPKSGPFPTRQAAIDFEVDWLNNSTG